MPEIYCGITFGHLCLNMGKYLFIAEKPSVAMEFAKALKLDGPRKNGYMEKDRKKTGSDGGQ